MICRHCGSEFVDGTKFCPVCGAPAEVEQQPVTPTVPSEKKAEHDGRRKSARISTTAAIVAVIAAVVAVAAMVIGIVVVANRGETAQFGQSADVPVALSTPIKINNADGESVSKFTAVLVRAANATGGTDDGIDTSLYGLDTTPYRIEVKDGRNISIKDFGDDVPDGRYVLYIQQSSKEDAKKDEAVEQEVTKSVIIDYKKDNAEAKKDVELSGSATVDASSLDNAATKDEGSEKAPEAKKDPREEAFKLFSDKVAAYQKKYGSAGKITSSDKKVTIATGLYVTKTVDFDGDGIEELLLVSGGLKKYPKAGDVFAAYKSFKVEVWAYRDGKLVSVFDQAGAIDHGNDLTQGLRLAVYGGKPAIAVSTYGPSDNSKDASGLALYQYTNGAFSATLSYSGPTDALAASEGAFTLNGKPAKRSDVEAALGQVKFTGYYATTELSGMKSGYLAQNVYGIDAVIKQTKNDVSIIKQGPKKASEDK